MSLQMVKTEYNQGVFVTVSPYINRWVLSGWVQLSCCLKITLGW